MPPQIGEFISQRVYDSRLRSYPRHHVTSSTTACRFVDIDGSEKRWANKSSYMVSRVITVKGNGANCRHQNQREVEAVTVIAEHLQEEDISYRIITPYDAQRSAIEQALKDKELDWRDKCFNVDSFQGSFNPRTYLDYFRSNTPEKRQRRPCHCHFRSPHERTRFLTKFETDKRHAHSVPARHVHRVKQGIPRRQRCRLAGRKDGRRVGKTTRRMAHSEGPRAVDTGIQCRL